jgi:methyl-accepting chemotaxis protein
VSEVSEVMSRIAQDTNTHAARLRQANVTVGEMDQITQSNAAMSEQASAAARGLAVQSGSLMKELGRFRGGRDAAGGERAEDGGFASGLMCRIFTSC